MNPAAFRGFRLVSTRQPVDVFAWAVAGHLELGSPHVFEFDLNRIAAVDRF
jgi:hypothetical protein